MSDATFLLLINLAIGVTFAAAFLALSWRSALPLGRWCALSFLCAAGTVTTEALAWLLGSVRLVSSLSYGLLMAAVTLIAIGLLRHYRPEATPWRLALGGAAAVAFNAVIGVGLERGTWIASLAYQLPFAAMLGAGALIVLRTSPRRPVDLAVALVLALCAAQFMAKIVLIPLNGADVGVHAYLMSRYARYSQTAGSILSLALGVSLLALVATEVMAATVSRLERDGLSNAFNRVAFFDRATPLLAAASDDAAVAVVMCDLDHFKTINDSHGHAAGDDVIRDVAGILLRHVGPQGLCGRIGGDEFCLVLPAASNPPADIADRITRDVAGLAYDWLPVGRRITLSLGLVRIAAPVGLKAAMSRADLALYGAKAARAHGDKAATS